MEALVKEEMMEANKLGLCELSLDDQRTISGGSWYEVGSAIIAGTALVAGLVAAPELLLVAAVTGATMYLTQ